MRTFKTFIIGFMILSLSTNCKKSDTPDPDPTVVPGTKDYYINNGLFHVFVNSDSTFNVIITHKKPNQLAPYNYEQAYQSSEFDYAFAPALGDSVHVVVQGKNSMYVDVSYIGTILEPAIRTTVGNYAYPATCCFTYAEYNYVVKK